MLGEIEYDIGGVIVNNDTCTYQERANLIVESGLMDWLWSKIESVGEVKICEIGGGYGALPHWFKAALPEALLDPQLELRSRSSREAAKRGIVDAELTGWRGAWGHADSRQAPRLGCSSQDLSCQR
jgi:hypothetical protein